MPFGCFCRRAVAMPAFCACVRRLQAFALGHVAADQVDAHVIEIVAALLLMQLERVRGAFRLRKVP